MALSSAAGRRFCRLYYGVGSIFPGAGSGLASRSLLPDQYVPLNRAGIDSAMPTAPAPPPPLRPRSAVVGQLERIAFFTADRMGMGAAAGGQLYRAKQWVGQDYHTGDTLNS